MTPSEDDFVEHPIDGTIDLHTFRPQDTAELLDAYFDACLDAEIYQVRIIHGKGQGILRRTVEAFLQKDPRVCSFAPGGISGGGWGATIAEIQRKTPERLTATATKLRPAARHESI